MVKYTWIKEELPPNLEIKQVYGIAFSFDKRILLRIDIGKYKLTGGKPEQKENFEETLKREYIEELNVELKDIYYLGYLLVEEDKSIPYAQVRMIAKIKKINEKKIDRRKSSNERILDFLMKVKNPYVFKINNRLVRMNFTENGPSADVCLTNMLQNLYR